MVRRRQPPRRTNDDAAARARGIYSEMVRDALQESQSHEPSTPAPARPAPKRRRLLLNDDILNASEASQDTMGPRESQQPSRSASPVRVDAVTETWQDPDDDDDDSEVEFEDVPIGLTAVGERPALSDTDQGRSGSIELELDLGLASGRAVKSRRPASLTNATRQCRIWIHKTHLLCLLWYCARRNHWCNDRKVHRTLRPLLSDRMLQYLNPPARLSQFGKAESLKTALQEVGSMFASKFRVTTGGMRRALWADGSIESLHAGPLTTDVEPCLDRGDFRKAARSLTGTRDVGAQLYCALLRNAGVEARLVCSLQVLSPGTGGLTVQEQSERPRAGRASTAVVHESAFPVFWVEVLDVGHGKWLPADPLVTRTFCKPRLLEPPASDRSNCLSYVVAFNANGSVRDVTRRYAKAYTAKTRRLRLEGVRPQRGSRMGGESELWWARVLSHFGASDPATSDLAQIEDIELAALEAREPMPRNVADFKDHPLYALERHFRRNEVLVADAKRIGTVGTGSRGALESIYRRSDVRVARTQDKWYRLGRVVKPDALASPAKVLPPTSTTSRMTASEGASSSLSPSLLGDNYARATAGGAAIFTIEQTDIFVPEPVVDGVVPKNRFGNIDVYVASMVPAGGTHLVDPLAGRAASIMGVDFAPALTGFQFRGSHGTALLHGVVVATEYVDAVKAVIDGLRYAEAEEQREMRVARALRMWRRFLLAVRIYDRICAPYVEVGKEDESSRATHRAVGVHPEETRRDSSPSANFHAFSKGVSVGHDNHYSQYPSLPDDGTMPPDGDDDDDYAGSGGFIIE